MVTENRNYVQIDDRGTSAGAAGFDLREQIRVVYRRRWLIITTIALITALTALVGLSLPPRYVTVASVLLEQSRGNLLDSPYVVEESTDSSSLVAEIKLLRSTTYAQKVVERLDLLSTPQYNPKLRDGAGPLDELEARVAALWDRVPASWRVAVSSRFPDSWLVAAGLAEQPFAPARADHALIEAGYTEGGESDPLEQAPSLPPPGTEEYDYLMQSAVRTVLAGLSIRAAGSNLILIEATSRDPRQAAQIADAVAEIYVQDQLEVKRQAVDEAVDWLRERVINLRQRVLESEGAVVALQEKHGLSGAAAAGADVGPQQELVRVRGERAQKQELLDWVQGLRERGAALDTIAAVLALPSLPELRRQGTELERQEAMLRMKYGDQHREIIQLQAGRHPINIQRSYLAETLGGEIQAALRKLESELAFAERRERELEERLGETATDTIPGGRAEVQLRDLQRQAEADRSLYVAFLNRFKQVSEQQDLLQSGAMVASRAGIPGEPEFPRPGLMTAAGFTVSLALGTLLAFMVEYLDSGLRTGRQVERALGIPSLGFVPTVSGLKSGQRLHRYLIANPRSAYTEAIRRVQIATMDAIDPGQESLVILVTSALPGEGKTTLALSLAASAACSGRRAVVVGLDLRRPRLRSEADLTPSAGIVEYLSGERMLEDVLYCSGDHDSLDILPVSSSPLSPADLIRSPRMATLIAELRPYYDYIVLDSPPVLGMVDAKLLARLADAVVFVVRWEATDEGAAQTGLTNLVDRHTPPIGAVLTQVDVRRHAKRGYGEAVQYHNRYEKYYT
ncbi:MAG TPA: Wzz/FepE/Etk N-terminal domain-containing protein [Geminicoccaceae bacterium]